MATCTVRYSDGTVVGHGDCRHVGKFSSCADEALWTATLDGCESTGDSTTYGLWAGLVPVDMPHEWLKRSRSLSATYDDAEVLVPGGWYIVTEQSSGFVDVDHFATEDEARAVFGFYEAAYAAWEGEDQ